MVAEKKTFNLLDLGTMPILQQLKLEERLLRGGTGNWCLLNRGSDNAIIMGISGKPEKLVNLPYLRDNPVPLIKRFSGGGTVLIDHETLFVTLIGETSLLSEPCYPKVLMKWSHDLYRHAFDEGTLSLRDNDYVIGERKCGGNAQYIQKTRWLHHTSFLWDYSPEKMANYLLIPERQPEYRKSRAHSDFLCTLSSYFSDRELFFQGIEYALGCKFLLKKVTLEKANEVISGTPRETTRVITSF
jgi:lipoate-protein ligase A